MLFSKNLSCYAALEGTTPVVDDWLNRYADVFGVTGDIPRLTSDGVLERIRLLHSSMDQVRENKWIKEHMIGAVDLWFGALTDHNVSHCNTAHFKELEFKLDHTVGIHRRPAINRDRMFELFHDKIGDLCRQSLIESLNASLSHETLADLQEIKFAHESWLDGKLSSKNLADKVFRQMSIQKSFNRKDIIDQWNRETHSCKILQQVVDSPDKRDTYNLLRHHALVQPSGSNQMQETIDFVFGMGSICTHLDSMVVELAKYYRSTVKDRLGCILSRQQVRV